MEQQEYIVKLTDVLNTYINSEIKNKRIAVNLNVEGGYPTSITYTKIDEFLHDNIDYINNPKQVRDIFLFVD